MERIIEQPGTRYGLLTVIGEGAPYRYPSGRVRHTVICKCDCGTAKRILQNQLRDGKTTSCGCYRKEKTAATKTKHGLRKSRLYRLWSDMKKRCYNPKNRHYNEYGGKGIRVADIWKNDFPAFAAWARGQGYADSRSIKRIDPAGDYGPENCIIKK